MSEIKIPHKPQNYKLFFFPIKNERIKKCDSKLYPTKSNEGVCKEME